jgi:hypothetical protein
MTILRKGFIAERSVEVDASVDAIRLVGGPAAKNRGVGRL